MSDPYEKLRTRANAKKNSIAPRKDSLFDSAQDSTSDRPTPPVEEKPLVEIAKSRNLRLEKKINQIVEEIVTQQKRKDKPITYDTLFEALILAFQSMSTEQQEEIIAVAALRRSERMKTGLTRRVKNTIVEL